MIRLIQDIGISIFLCPVGGLGDSRTIPQGVTVRKFDEKENLPNAQEGRSPYGQDRAEAKRKPILMKRIEKVSGFSLIELLIVLAVLGSLALLLMPKFESYTRYIQLRRDSWIIVSDLRQYHQKSITEHYQYKFVFNLTDDSYTIEQYSHPEGQLLEPNVKTEELQVDITDATDLTFLPDGTATNTSAIMISLSNAEGGTSKITVAKTTGYVKAE